MVALWLVVWACGEPDVVETVEEDLRRLHIELEVDGSGRTSIPIDVHANETAMLATARAWGGRTVHVMGLDNASGDTVLSSDDWVTQAHSRANALFPAGTVSLNWPIDASDGDLGAGDWTLQLGLIEEGDYGPGALTVDVHLKKDDDFDQGLLDVALVYTDGLDADPALRSAVREATGQWEYLFGLAGIEVAFVPLVWPGDPPSASPAADMDRIYTEISSSLGPRTMAVVFVSTLPVLDTALGIAGDVPGPLVATQRSAVVISHTSSSGPDLEYSFEEVRILAETLAHEGAHYIGLFHPVESSWTHWDTLEDTLECSSKDDCEDELGSNLMFPYPVCDRTECVHQSVLSDAQASVLQRNTAVR